MKKYIVVFIILIITSGFYFFSPFNSGSEFVSIEDDEFILNGSPFYPLAVNYIVTLQTDGNDLWVRPGIDYSTSKDEDSLTKTAFLQKFKTDMDSIKAMGFNSVRIVRVGEVLVDEAGILSVNANINNDEETSFVLTNNKANYKKYFNALDEMLSIINEADLKVIFLVRMVPRLKSTADHLKKIAKYFENNPTILAYDLFNEPLYFDRAKRGKNSVIFEVAHWDSIVAANDTNHLITIGLAGIREVFEWDPNIINVDFISFHPYEYEPEQVRNELYWYNKYVKKPWIIGETSVPADNDSVPYKEQKDFAAKTLKQAYDCGAKGYSWWQYKDVLWGVFHSDYMGVSSSNGLTKPVAEVFKNFNPSSKKDSCLCLSNYYNYSNGGAFRLSGKITDSTKTPIQGAVILAWNQDWTHSYHTITKEDGSFELLGTYPFHHWIVSATEHNTIDGHFNPETAAVGEDNIPTIDLDTITIHKLDWLIRLEEK